MRAPDRERVTDDRPLRLAPEAEDLAEIVNQAGGDEPARLVGPADGLGRLHRVLDLGEVDVGVAVVDERVQVLQGLPHAHRPAVEREVLALLPEDELHRLVRVVLPVELAHGGPLFGGKVPERFARLRLVDGAARMGLLHGDLLADLANLWT